MFSDDAIARKLSQIRAPKSFKRDKNRQRIIPPEDVRRSFARKSLGVKPTGGLSAAQVASSAAGLTFPAPTRQAGTVVQRNNYMDDNDRHDTQGEDDQ